MKEKTLAYLNDRGLDLGLMVLLLLCHLRRHLRGQDVLLVITSHFPEKVLRFC
jgi:hypothetical protein